ncbi:tRNA-dihydrouridine synthase 1, partial [Phenoliferia sp. Uapishka_3]
MASSPTLPDPIPAQPTPRAPGKLEGHEWWTSIGSPKYVVAPMVDQSELAWRILSRLHGATLAYTPMFHAGLFGSSTSTHYQEDQFDMSPDSLEGVAPYDRPLVVQFCANDKDLWLQAAKKVEGRCDAVDLNLGCPQGIAKKGRYGAFLMDEWELIGGMISHLHAHLAIPVIAKLRVFPTLERTLAYATHVFQSGAQLLTIHGRTREAKGRQAGFASWSKINSITSLLGSKVPILANGGVPNSEDVEPCIRETGALGVMSAEGNLYNPMLFSPSNAAGGREYRACLPEEMQVALAECDAELVGEWDRDQAAYAPATFLAAQYLAIVKTLPSTQTGSSAIKAHLFKLFRPIWAQGRHLEIRESLGNSGRGVTREQKDAEYAKVVDQMRELIKADLAAGLLPPNSHRPLTHAEAIADFNGVVPYSHAQPYYRVAAAEESSVLVDSTELQVSEKRARSPTDETVPMFLCSPANPEEDAKKARLSTTDREAAPTENTKACARSSHVPPCVNSAAVRCSHSACLACCKILSFGEGATGCEFHEAKERAQKEKNAAKKAANNAKKALKKAGQKNKKGGAGVKGVKEAVVEEVEVVGA